MKAGQRVAVIGVRDDGFLRDLRERTPDVSLRRRAGCDVIVVAVERPGELRKIGDLKGFIKPDGGIWIVTPKGSPGLNWTHVIAAILAAGLVDNKGISFSDTHSALRAVVRLKDRPQA